MYKKVKETKNYALTEGTHYWYVLMRLSVFLVTTAITLVYSYQAGAETIIVTNTNDSGPGSFRQAIISAAAGDTINFAVTGTITLTNGELQISKNLSINGPGEFILAISGNNSSRVFDISTEGVNISDITVSDGNSFDSPGGGIQIEEASSLTLTSSIIKNNAGDFGGGINNEGSLIMTNVTISGNVATLWGGGICNTGNMTIHNSTVSDNTAIVGGGISNAVFLSSGGRRQAGMAVLENVTVSGNEAADFGGGIASGGQKIGGVVFPTLLALRNCTLSNNSAPIGSGLHSEYGNTTLRNTIIASSSIGGNCDNTITSLSHNLESSNTCGFTADGDIVNADPLLGALVDNDGLTQTHALLPGSPAINSADPANYTPVDQRGISRPQGSGPDIGAYELIEVTSVQNFHGTIGTRFTITVATFGMKKPQVYVECQKKPGVVKRVYAKVEKWNDASITCRWTENLSAGIYNLWVKPNIRNVASLSAGKFIIVNPVIDIVTPKTFSYGALITIDGYFFTDKKPVVYIRDLVSLKRKRCKVLSSTMDPATGASSLNFVFPNLGSSNFEIILQTRLGKISVPF